MRVWIDAICQEKKMNGFAVRLLALFLVTSVACGTADSKMDAGVVDTDPDVIDSNDADATTGGDLTTDGVVDFDESDLADAAGDDATDPDSGNTTGLDVLTTADTVDVAGQDTTDESAIPVCAEPAEPLDWGDIDPSYTPVSSGSAFVDKNVYLLALFEMVAEVGAVFDSGDLATMGTNRVSDFETMAKACSEQSCDISVALWSEQDIDSAGAMLTAALALDDPARTALINHVRSSGKFGLFTALGDDDLVRAVWNQAISALNDSAVRFASDVGVSATNEAVQTSASVLADKGVKQYRAFEPLARLVLALVDASGRDEAARYEPLAGEGGENAAAIATIPDIDWDAYPYTVILVPGWGPDDLETPLSDVGAQHCDLAVERWLAGWARFIAVSGGHVHPDRTPYAEAIEMKRYLMETHGVPEDAIIIDPHARHTTTNLRNVSRLVIAYGIPPERPLVTTTDFMQSAYITALGDRCMEELGYLPWREITALTLEDNCMYLSPDVLRVAPEDPLDP